MAHGFTHQITETLYTGLLDNLDDVTVTSVGDNDILAWDEAAAAWVNQTAAEAGLAAAVDDLTDVTITTVASGELLVYTGSVWENQTLAEAGVAADSHNHDSDYVSVIVDPVEGDFPAVTAGGELASSGYAPADFAAAAHAHAVDDLSDVTLGEPTTGDVLTYDTDHWEAAAPSGGAVADLTDAVITDPSDGQVLTYDSTSETWVNEAVPAGGSPALDDLSDVVLTDQTAGELLVCAAGGLSWENQTLAEAGVSATSHSHTVDGLSDAVITDVADNEVLAYDTGGNWINQTAAEAGLAAATHTHTVYFPFCQSGELETSTDTGAFRLYLPHAMTITKVGASVGVAPTGASVIVDVHKDGTTIFSTQANRPEIAASGFWSGWETPDVTAFSADSYLTVNIDQIGSTLPGENLTVIVYATRSA